MKLRTFTLTMLTVLTCDVVAGAQTDGSSVTGMTSLGLAGNIDHPATLADVQVQTLELGVSPGPYGLWDLTMADVYAAVGDTLHPTIAGLRGMAGHLWYELRGTVGRSWALADGADVGLTTSVGVDGGADLERRWWLLLSGGLRWHVDTLWTIGVTLSDVLTLGRSPSQNQRLTMGVGLRCTDGVDVTVDTSVDPLAGFGVLLGARMDVHSRLTVRCTLRSHPTTISAGIRCDVAAATSVVFDVGVVRDLGSRTRIGVLWQR